MSLKERPNKLPLPPIFMAIFLIGSYVLHRTIPIGWEPEKVTSFMQGSGGFLIVIALAIEFWTIATLRRHKTTVHPTKAASQLAQDGPFALSRNPIYLANVLICIGASFVIGSRWYLLAAAVMFVLLSELVIKGEEKHLQAQFPEAWDAYKDKVRRWL